MKKIFALLILFCSILILGQKYQGTITYKNGSKKTGLIAPISEITSKNQISYKENENAPKQKISLASAVQLEYNVDGNIAIAEPFIYDRETVWAYKIHDGKLKVYANSQIEKNSYWTQGNLYSQSTELKLYFMKYKDEPGKLVSMFMDAGPLTINTFQKKGNEKILLKYFENKCPKLIEAFKNKEIKIKMDPYPFVEYFEKNCE